MARRPKRQYRRSGGRRATGRYIKGNIDELLDVGTLASRTLVRVVFSETVNERTLVSSIKASWSLSSATGGNSIGPILVGVAHSDYSAAEIEALIESTLTWNEGDKIAQEVGKRLIRKVGQFNVSASAADTDVLNNGKPIKIKLNWILNQGQTLSLWAYNLGTVAFGTIDPDIHLEGDANLWPR